MAITVLVASGCSKASSDGRPVASPVTVSASAMPGASRPGNQGPLLAYRAMMNDLVVVSRNPNENDPRLRDHASAGALMLLRYIMEADRQKDVVGRGTPVVDPTIVKSAATQAVIRDCIDDTQWLLYTRDGELENDVPGGRHRVDATLEVRAGAWRVVRLYFDQVGTC
ncbi:hypothetical protein [Actinacidiphila yeochonensis]|uniref:hypothetical protein n=1 Tax=Actinacidiphila yeochonensis TaxID=89050 RepID=UPI0012FE9FC6|nr:hypothetical protein [Actinacidiphila yeochonensis]